MTDEPFVAHATYMISLQRRLRVSITKRTKGDSTQMMIISSASSSMQVEKAMSGNLRLREFSKMYD